MGTPEQARLDKEFPKRCGCGRTWAVDGTFFDWKSLPLLGLRTDDFATFELRNCVCGSTLMAAVEIHDLAAE